MPTYEYACRSCDEHFDVVQSIGDDPLTECPSCGGPLRKVFGAVGVVFKGSGFYKTDNRGSSKRTERGEKAERGDAASGSADGAKAGSDGTTGSSDGAKGGAASGPAKDAPKAPAKDGASKSPSGSAAAAS